MNPSHTLVKDLLFRKMSDVPFLMNLSDSVLLRVSVSRAPSFFAQSHKAFFRTGYRGQVPLVQDGNTSERGRTEGTQIATASDDSCDSHPSALTGRLRLGSPGLPPSGDML